ncbi:MAG: DUF1800 domain-containing protein [Pseudomonadota bacterium]|nr:DUF1800 domain-containing protein [Pseudomonadota bacterium]
MEQSVQSRHTRTRSTSARQRWPLQCLLVGSLVLAGCGGGGSGGASSSGATPVSSVPPVTAPPAPATDLPGETQAARFLAQATFGPAPEDISHLSAVGYSAWMDEQFALPTISHQAVIDDIMKVRRAQPYDFYPTFWKQAATAPDQLRQRVKFALSEIFVVSLNDPNVAAFPRGAASYYDMLGAGAFGNFRDLLEHVTLHPMMGLYLTSLHNSKEGPNRTPDENFAREVMQLFTIGLYQLNQDGSVKTNAQGPIPTYTLDDITNAARVYTGFSWSGPDTTDARFNGTGPKDPDRDITPMQPYPQWHSTSAKNFLGVSIPAGSTDARADLKIALDTLFNHPNTGPFIGRQLIQRLVTSNPSPAYIARVAAAFANNGQGVRGDMKAVVKAVLLDPEALSATGLADPTYGKVREPVVRLAQWMRAFKATSQLGTYYLRDTSDPEASLGQSPLTAPSVFNFYRPGYAPAGSDLAARNLVGPELQGVDETSVIGYGNFMQRVVQRGIGAGGPPNSTPPDSIAASYDTLLPLAADPAQLLDRIDLLLTARQLSPEDRQTIITATNAVPVTSTDAQKLAQAKLTRVQLAVYLTMLSPAYLVQK